MHAGFNLLKCISRTPHFIANLRINKNLNYSLYSSITTSALLKVLEAFGLLFERQVGISQSLEHFRNNGRIHAFPTLIERHLT